MPKSKFVLLLALFAITLQKSNGASVQNPRRTTEHIIDQVNKIISTLTSDLTNSIHDLSKTLIELSDLPNVIKKLKKEVNPSSKRREASVLCKSSTWNEVKLLEEFIEKSEASCRIALDTEASPLREQLGVLTITLKDFEEKVHEDYNKCIKMTEETHSYEEFADCMKTTVDYLHLQIEDVDGIIHKVWYTFDNLIPALNDNVMQCVNEAKKYVDDKAQAILKYVYSCWQDE